jgi:hypothetical protein
MRRQRRALERLLLGLVLVAGLGALALDLTVEFSKVGVQRLFEQALLFGRQGAGEALAGGC